MSLVLAAAGADPTEYAGWLVSRAAGLTAVGLLTASVWLGLASAGGLLRRRPHLRAQVGVVHEMLALGAIGALVVHVVALLFDGWLNPSVPQLLIPFTMPIHPVWYGLGQLAGWVVVLLGPTFYLRRRIGAKRWRQLHTFVLGAFVLAVAHVIGGGTDGRSVWVLGPLLGGTAIVAVLAAIRGGRAARRRGGGTAPGGVRRPAVPVGPAAPAPRRTRPVAPEGAPVPRRGRVPVATGSPAGAEPGRERVPVAAATATPSRPASLWAAPDDARRPVRR